jgi:hypothetical protein
MFAEIGYIEPMTTGAPFRFDAVAAELAAADVADADGADVLELLLEQAEAAAASARQAKPVAKRGHFFVAIILSPPYAELRHTYSFRTLIVEVYFRALYSSDVRTSMGSGHSSPRCRHLIRAPARYAARSSSEWAASAVRGRSPRRETWAILSILKSAWRV